MGDTLNPKTDRQRIFIAAWPDDIAREALRDTANSILKTGFQAKQVKPENIHITIAFLGDLIPAAVETIKHLLSNFQLSHITLNLNRLGYWRKPRVVWLGCRDKPTGLITEIESLHSQLRRLGFRVDERGFVPHVTVFRKAAKRPHISITPIEWPVSELTVVRSTLTSDGPNYEIIATSDNK
ncbi:MAG: RNA 2',3'-cyclic phosphodiesterase [Gammaproteobacteria bacterium]|nr:RNA 2',3'-cyclic phosphodiesterase [Gammaproteobacteria bacterium]